MSDFDAFESSDPTADFLEREKAILGAEAALFGNPMADMPATDIPASDAGFGEFTDNFSTGDAQASQEAPASLVSATVTDNQFGFDLVQNNEELAFEPAFEPQNNFNQIINEPVAKPESQALL